MTKNIFTLLLFFLPLLLGAESVRPDSDADYHLDMGFRTNSRDAQNPFVWYQGDVMTIKAAKKEATSSKEAQVMYVEYYVDGKKIGKSTEAPYQLDYRLDGISAGTHKLLTKVYWKAKRHRFVSDFNWTLTVRQAAD